MEALANDSSVAKCTRETLSVIKRKGDNVAMHQDVLVLLILTIIFR